MKPPWEVEPENYTDKFWLTTRSEYRDSWRDWFVQLSPEEQDRYKAENTPPEICVGEFYDIFGHPPYDPHKFADGFRDEDGDLPAPWVAFPEIPMGSIGWRMGHGEDYWHIFDQWFRALTQTERNRIKAKYPEPAQVQEGLPWTGFYERKERNG